MSNQYTVESRYIQLEIMANTILSNLFRILLYGWFLFMSLLAMPRLSYIEFFTCTLASTLCEFSKRDART